MTHKLFIYGTLMNDRLLELLIPGVKILSKKPGYIFGKMYNMENAYPVVIRPNQGKKSRNPCIVYGAIIEIECEENDLRALDDYEGCSYGSTGKNEPYDLYHRVFATATEIEFDSMINFTQYKYNLGQKHKVITYLGNMDNPKIYDLCMNSRRSGNVWRTFFNYFDS